MGSSGYGSHGSNGSHEQQVSISSSSESNGNAGRTTEETGKAKPTRTFQEICKGVHMLKNQDSQAGLPSPSPSTLLSKLEQKRTSDSETRLLSLMFFCSCCLILNISGGYHFKVLCILYVLLKYFEIRCQQMAKFH